jgi:hypothetical protein
MTDDISQMHNPFIIAGVALIKDNRPVGLVGLTDINYINSEFLERL